MAFNENRSKTRVWPLCCRCGRVWVSGRDACSGCRGQPRHSLSLSGRSPAYLNAHGIRSPTSQAYADFESSRSVWHVFIPSAPFSMVKLRQKGQSNFTFAQNKLHLRFSTVCAITFSLLFIIIKVHCVYVISLKLSKITFVLTRLFRKY